MSVLKLSPRLYKLVLEEAARDGVSLSYAADRLYDRLLEAANEQRKRADHGKSAKSRTHKGSRGGAEKSAAVVAGVEGLIPG